VKDFRGLSFLHFCLHDMTMKGIYLLHLGLHQMAVVGRLVQ